MHAIEFQGRAYQIDEEGFLIDSGKWDEDFAEGTAKQLGIQGGLTADHWKVIRHIRDTFAELGRFPILYELCRALKLRLADLKSLFPSGYLRGACLVAGVTYKEEGFDPKCLPQGKRTKFARPDEERTYRIDLQGFLVDPSDWDEDYAIHRAKELKMAECLTAQHWEIIGFMRQAFEKTGRVPTVYETCESNHIELDELEVLFPDGYHRGVVKLSGLRVK